MSNNFYGAIALTGGGAGALDAIDGAALTDLDGAFVQVLNELYFYSLDADSAAAEDSPNVISPDTNAGDKRWIMQRLMLPDGTGALPSVALGSEKGTGFYFQNTNVIGVSVGNAVRFSINSVGGGQIRGSGGSGAIINEVPSSINPTVVPNIDDIDTGLSQAGADAVALTAGAKEGIRVTEASNETITEIKSNGINTSKILSLVNTAGEISLFRTDATPESVITGDIGDLAMDSTNGIFYIKNSGTGTNTGWLPLTPASRNLGEMILHDNSTAMVIDSDDKEHALRLFSAGDLSGWTFDAGLTGVIADTANNSGTLRITDVAHGLVTGDVVTITGLATAAQNDVTMVTYIDDDTFDCDDITYVTASETGWWNQGSALTAGTLAAGTYLIHYGVSSLSASVTPEITYHVYINTTRQDGDAIQFDLSTAAGRGFMSQIVTIAAGDIVWVSALETGNNVDITNIFSNLNLHRL